MMESVNWSESDFGKYFLCLEPQDLDAGGIGVITMPAMMTDEFYEEFCGKEEMEQKGDDDYFNTWICYHPKDGLLYFFVDKDSPNRLEEIVTDTQITGWAKDRIVREIKEAFDDEEYDWQKGCFKDEAKEM